MSHDLLVMLEKQALVHHSQKCIGLPFCAACRTSVLLNNKLSIIVSEAWINAQASGTIVYWREAQMTQEEVSQAKARLEAAGETPLVSVCTECDIEFDVKMGGETYPPGLRISHGYCPPCARRVEERFNLGKDTQEIQ